MDSPPLAPPASIASRLDRELTLRDYGRVLWSGRWLILLTAVAAAIIGLILTFAKSTDFTSTARVALGQPTTVAGVPTFTPATNPRTAASILTGDDIVAAVARKTGLSEDRIRNGVQFSIPTTPGASAASQPSVADITFSDHSKGTAERVVDAYANAVLAKLSAPYLEVLRVSQARVDADKARQQDLLEKIPEYEQLVQRSSGTDRVAALSLLFAAQSQLQTTLIDLSDAQLQVAKAIEIEQPGIVATSNGATSSSSIGNRARTVVLAAIIGLLLGIVVTFVWRGSPAGRAARRA